MAEKVLADMGYTVAIARGDSPMLKNKITDRKEKSDLEERKKRICMIPNQ